MVQVDICRDATDGLRFDVNIRDFSAFLQDGGSNRRVYPIATSTAGLHSGVLEQHTQAVLERIAARDAARLTP
jgi:hypothetical protein